MDNLLVTIGITCYNEEKCIGSILGQTYSNIEIIVVDNCSTDNTISVLKQYNNRVCLIQHDEEHRKAVFVNSERTV